MFYIYNYIEELQQGARRDLGQKYKAAYGSIPDHLEDFDFYKVYLNNFPSFPVNKSDSFRPIYNWELLQKFIIGSYGLSYEISDNNLLYFTHKTNPKKRKFSELHCYTIVSLYEALLSEQIMYDILKETDVDGLVIVNNLRKERLDKWERTISKVFR